MNVISFEEKRRQKRTEQILGIPVYENLNKNENGELTGKLIDYVDMPKELFDKED